MDKYSAIDLREMGKSITIVLPSSFSFYINNDDEEHLRTCTFINHNYGGLLGSSHENKRKTAEHECELDRISSPVSSTNSNNIKRQKTSNFSRFNIFDGKEDNHESSEYRNMKIEPTTTTINSNYGTKEKNAKDELSFNSIYLPYQSANNNNINSPVTSDASDFFYISDEEDESPELMKNPNIKIEPNVNIVKSFDQIKTEIKLCVKCKKDWNY